MYHNLVQRFTWTTKRRLRGREEKKHMHHHDFRLWTLSTPAVHLSLTDWMVLIDIAWPSRSPAEVLFLPRVHGHRVLGGPRRDHHNSHHIGQPIQISAWKESNSCPLPIRQQAADVEVRLVLRMFSKFSRHQRGERVLDAVSPRDDPILGKRLDRRKPGNHFKDFFQHLKMQMDHHLRNIQESGVLSVRVA